MAALLAAQHISRATQFQVEGRDFEAGAEIGELLQRGQPPARNRCQLDFGWQQEVGIRPTIRSSHPPSQLIQLRQSERSEEHTSELQSPDHLVCRLLLEKK